MMCFLDRNLAAEDPLFQEPSMLRSVKKMDDLILGWPCNWDDSTKSDELSRIAVKSYMHTPLCAAAALNFMHMLQYLFANGAMIDAICSLRSVVDPFLRALWQMLYVYLSPLELTLMSTVQSSHHLAHPSQLLHCAIPNLWHASLKIQK